jgi:hypothetical protein
MPFIMGCAYCTPYEFTLPYVLSQVTVTAVADVYAPKAACIYAQSAEAVLVVVVVVVLFAATVPEDPHPASNVSAAMATPILYLILWLLRVS